MLSTLAPSAVIPPSAKAKAWTPTTTVSTRQASQGPSRAAAKVAPRKWPLVPPATGKLSIWAAKMNAASTPSIGIRDSSSSRSETLSAIPTASAASTAATAATPALRNPSGMWSAIGRTVNLLLRGRVGLSPAAAGRRTGGRCRRSGNGQSSP